jgi:outer membrane DcaP-like protein
MLKSKKTLLACSLLALATTANAGFEIKLEDNATLTFGGYFKADYRYISGNVAPRDYWIGTGAVLDESQSNLNFAVNESRFNTKYVHGDVTGYLEMDFYGAAVKGGYGGANEVFTNSSNPRIRHAFIKYKDLLVGQTWSTFVNTSTFAETADFGGALNAEAFVRQTQVRYTTGNWQIAIENPESYGGQRGQDSIPDAIVRYNIKGDWGNVAVSGLIRQLTTELGSEESAFGLGITGKIKTYGKDDVRFQFHTGNTGRYVGVAAATDLWGEKVEDSTSVMVAYRHFWTDTIRSTVFYGNTQTDLSDRDRTHWGVNIFKSYTKNLSFGFELGNFEMANTLSASGNTRGGDSDYMQFTAKYVL